MEAEVNIGPDTLVAYQNEASAKLRVSRSRDMKNELEELESIIAALECPELPTALCAGSHPLGTPHAGLSGSQLLAKRLRRFLPQPPG